MARIIFLVDFEEGHILSTMSLSKTLAARGNTVVYAGIPDAEETIAGQGFAFYQIMADVFPKGSTPSCNQTEASIKGVCFARCVKGDLVDHLIREFRPNVAVVLSYHYLEGLAIHYRHGLPIIFFTPDLRIVDRAEAASSIIDGLMNATTGVAEFLDLLRAAGVTVRSLSDVVALALKIPELIALPKSFEATEIHQDPLVYYIGGGVDLCRREESRQWRTLADGRPLIYCSLGSQAALRAEASTRFFNSILQTLAARPEWYLALSVGKKVDIATLSPLPANVYAANWIPQMDVLSNASLMITHGGIGTVKECILSRVPMIGFPLMRDQFDCAERVVQLGLGLSGCIETVTPTVLADMIGEVLHDAPIRRNINAMDEAFRDEECVLVGAEIVEGYAGRATDLLRDPPQSDPSEKQTLRWGKEHLEC
jgi:zeaxanthin glucosyltransferase